MKKTLLALASIVLMCTNAVGGTIYTINEEDSPHGGLYTLNPSTGAATLAFTISSSDDLSPSLLGGAYDSSRDTLFFTTYFISFSNAGLADINYRNGEGRWVGEIGGPENTSNVFGAAYDSTNDVLYASDDDQSPVSLITIDRDTGAGTTVGPFDASEDLRINGMAYDAATDTLYGIGEDNLFTINRSTGEATSVGAHGLSGNIQMGLAIDPDNGVMYLVHNQNLYSVNKQTAQVSLIGPTGLTDIGSLAVVPGGAAAAAIPSTGAVAQWILILAVLLAAVALRTRLQGARAD